MAKENPLEMKAVKSGKGSEKFNSDFAKEEKGSGK